MIASGVGSGRVKWIPRELASLSECEKEQALVRRRATSREDQGVRGPHAAIRGVEF
jgi:hypothetical protein